MGWKWCEQEECVVLLDEFKRGEGDNLMQFGCGHRFHSKCLVPWLDGNAHFPCCRIPIPS
ncbi:hypothetical protein ACS0TY_021181 [Phlomoides rotata]